MLPHYLVAWKAGRGPESLLISSESGAEALVAFSSREVAETFIGLRALEEEWYARTSSPGEIISLLCGLYIGAGWVSLNPLPAPLTKGHEKSIVISRKAYIDFFLG
jgi:hypothetical protein